MLNNKKFAVSPSVTKSGAAPMPVLGSEQDGCGCSNKCCREVESLKREIARLRKMKLYGIELVHAL